MLQPALEFCFRISVDVAGGIKQVGNIGKGVRKVVPITGGTFEGPDIKGRVVGGGYDWQLQQENGITEIDARYILQADDGALITIANTGLRHGPVDVMKRLSIGEEVNPAAYYFRSIPVFETGAPQYQWLSQSVFIASGTRKPTQVLIDVWRVV